VYRLLLAFYPASFRVRFGDELLRFWKEQRFEPRYQQRRIGDVRYWLELAWDAVGTGLRMRLRHALGVRDGGPTAAPGERSPLGRRRYGRWVMGVIGQDVRYAVRSLWGSPLYSLAAVMTLALGIGANAAIFSVVNGVVLRPLPYDDPAELYALLTDASVTSAVSWPDFADWQERTDLFAGVAGAIEFGTDVQWNGEAEQLQGGGLTAGSLAALGVSPILGRGFSAEEDTYGGPDVVLLSEGLWERRFGRDPQVLGRTVSMGGDSHTVVGVLPASFAFPDPGLQLWTPLKEAEAIEEAGFSRSSRTIGFIRATGRLAPGTDPRRVAEALTAMVRQAREAEGIDIQEPPTITLLPLHDQVVGNVRGMMLLVFGAVGLVLLVACANMAGLALTRATSREGELAIRTAMGASRGRLMGQMLAESTVLAAGGGLLGLVLAYGLTDLLVRLAPPGLPRIDEVAVDGTVLAFTAAASIVTGIAFGLAPALRAARPDLQDALKSSGRGSGQRAASQRIQQGLVVAQVALAVTLVTGAALLINSFVRLTSVETGFEAENLMKVSVTLPSGGYEDALTTVTFYDELLARVRALPGVLAASATYSPPLSQNEFRQTIVLEGQEEDRDNRTWVGTVIAQSDYFRTVGVDLVRGRTFGPPDGPDDAPVAVVNETMARTLWPDQDPLGQRFTLTGGIWGSLDRMSREFFPKDPFTVIGVVEDVRRSSLGEAPTPEFYRPHAQMGWGSLALMVRTTGDAPQIVAAVRRTIWERDSSVAVSDVLSMGQLMSRSVAAPRFRTLLMGGFALIACLLAMVGVYAVMAYAVARRTREIGIRMALGAQAGRVRRDVLRRGLGISAVGLALGLMAAAVGSRVLASMLFQVSPTDPVTFLLVATLVTLFATLASYVPARRASQVDPVRSMQTE